ncbi:uncharacterized protein LOC108735691 [Agrilus planipennis]|uniref:Uncharacterized protein LOC108735691 n=1 Tax=Agrilus planipennis TaxID=224129 RepID=A0A1W4WTB3_AGRPL|nr:uncharacterized protein LOC108735691 [Agrilus planipennis]
MMSLFIILTLLIQSSFAGDLLSTEDTEEEKEWETLRTRTLPPVTDNPFSKDSSSGRDEINTTEIEEAVRDIGYFLRNHKFNEWDRRYYRNGSSGPRDYHMTFPRPPLRSLHWEVRKFCEESFVICVKYVAQEARSAGLKRQDDSVYVTIQQKWFESNYSEQVNAIDSHCRALKSRDDITGRPFQGPIERYQWRVTATYYMCWYTLNEVPFLRHFNETCDNSANCIGQLSGLYNNDPRAKDEQPFACALYSFCPDMCCTLPVTNDTKSCWEQRKDNPCFEGNPAGQRDCSMELWRNTDFNDIVLNRWNVTCKCPREGVEWNSRFGMCIDVDECLLGLHNCSLGTQECINLVGSFRCVCRWGYIWDKVSQGCTESKAVRLITYRKQEDDSKKSTSETETSFIKRILRMFQGPKKQPNRQ